MRFVVYIVAVLAAAGIVYFVSGNAEQQVAEVAAPGAEESVVVEEATAPTVEGDVKLISLKIPSMHCPVACYPSVKKTLESEAGVSEVELAEQQEEGVIDNPVVLIKAGSNFDLEKAISTLAGTGFDDAAVIE